jgi:hypothetical protein
MKSILSFIHIMHNDSIVLRRDKENFMISRSRNSLPLLHNLGNTKNVLIERTIDSTYNPSLSAALATLSALIDAAEGPLAATTGMYINILDMCIYIYVYTFSIFSLSFLYIYVFLLNKCVFFVWRIVSKAHML